jgi:hypothetical protein
MNDQTDDILIISKKDEITTLETIKPEDILAFPDGIYQWVYYISFTQPLHITVGIYYEMYLCALFGVFLFLTSINYWKYPLINSNARKVDIFCAYNLVAYQYYLSLYTINNIVCISIMTTGLSMYPLSLCLQHKYNYISAAAICHCLIHMCLSLNACFIYQDFYEQGKSLKWHL